jgi:hypothetical protein
VTLNNVLKVVMNKKNPEQISSGSFNYLLNLGRVLRELTGRSGRQQREVGRLLGEVNCD